MALSQAPPEFELEIAIWTDDTIHPGKSPATAFVPKKNPNNKGVKITLKLLILNNLP